MSPATAVQIPRVARATLISTRDRAIRVMGEAERELGRDSDARVVAWTVLSEVSAILDGVSLPCAFRDAAERELGLDAVETMCTGEASPDVVDVVAEMANRPSSMR